MALQNTGHPFSESTSVPIILVGASTPGTLIHKSATDADDYVWLWVSNVGEVAAEVRLYKGEPTLGYILDSIVVVPAKSGKVLLEPGILLTGGIELRGFVALTSDSTRPPVHASGHIHRRID